MRKRKITKEEKKESQKRKIKFKASYLFILAFSVYFVYTVVDQQLQINKFDSQIKVYKEDIKTKAALIEYYNNQEKNINTDEYIESVARETLGYVKPYEKVFIDTNK